jgi:hypothetical protein
MCRSREIQGLYTLRDADAKKHISTQLRWVIPMHRQPMSRLQSDLSKLFSHLLEEDIVLSPYQAHQIASQVTLTYHTLDLETNPNTPNGKQG